MVALGEWRARCERHRHESRPRWAESGELGVNWVESTGRLDMGLDGTRSSTRAGRSRQVDAVGRARAVMSDGAWAVMLGGIWPVLEAAVGR
jgi:hypothetical protein